MKHVLTVLFALLLLACSTESSNQEYVTIKGKLKTKDLDKITIQGKGFSKEISVDENGKFSDTLKVTDGVHAIVNGTDRITLFLRNGYNLELTFKGEKLEHGVIFTGVGSSSNNFIENKRSFYNSAYAIPNTYFELDSADYRDKLTEAKAVLKKYKDNAGNLDSVVAAMDSRNDTRFFGYIEDKYEEMHKSALRLAPGKPSPEFINYENFKGGKSSLSDFKGSYVFIDIWATWCAPCKVEIPFLKKLEDEYQDKNIKFVSISVDRPDAYDAWKQMVTDLQLGGVQLIADTNFDSEFILKFKISGIPRFILIDPNGAIINSDAPRPSNPLLKEVLDELLLND